MLAASLLIGTAAIAADADIVITEVMQNPSVMDDADGEWFEIHNTGPDPVDIQGWTIKDDGTDSYVIPTGSPLVVPADGYAVIGHDTAVMAAEGVTLLCEFTGFLGNSGDELVLLNVALTEIDRIMWDGGPSWPDPTGASMMWDETTDDNNVAENWSTSDTPFGSGDFGTPGAPNGGVPLVKPDVYNVYHRSILPEPAETVTVYADATDDGTITGVDLYVQVNGGGFTSSAMSLVSGDTYSGTIAGGLLGDVVDYYVAATDNDAQTTTNPYDAPVGYYSYTVADETITPIATIHADSLGYVGTPVMIQAQVYIPGDYQADGTSVSAFVQDGSGRGMNIYGTTRVTGETLLNDTSAIVKISGYAYWFGTTVELTNYEVEPVSTGNPVLTPTTLSTLDAAAPSNEGTYIATSGPITVIETTGGDNPCYNFTINDGSGDVVIRVDEDLAVGMDTWLVGDALVAAGAGGAYYGVGQIKVGLASDLVNNGQGPDLTPPVLVSAELTAATEVTLQFDDNIDPVTGSNAANYEVYETATPANTIAVSSAVVQVDDTYVVLTLAASASGTPHTVRVNDVQDTDGNPIVDDSTMAIFEAVSGGDIIITEIMQNPAYLYDSDGEWFEVYNAGASAVDMNGWTIKDAGTNVHVIDNGGPLVINPGEYKVFALNAASMTAEGVSVFYEYVGITLANGDDEIILLDGTMTEIDNIAYDGGPIWPDPNGRSMQYGGVGERTDGANWGDTGPVFGTGYDRGTPGAVNDIASAVPEADLFTSLGRNYPNPFNPKTSFSFTLKTDDRVKLSVYDMRGREIATVVDADLRAGD